MKSKVAYWILYCPDGNIGRVQEVYRSATFDREKIHRAFDEWAHKMKPGDNLQYGKEDAKRFYPAMLYVECRENGLFKLLRNGYFVKYEPTY